MTADVGFCCCCRYVPRVPEKKQINFLNLFTSTIYKHAFFNTTIFAMWFWLLLRRTRAVNYFTSPLLSFNANIFLLVAVCSLRISMWICKWRSRASSTNTSNKYWTWWGLLLDASFVVDVVCLPKKRQRNSFYLFMGNKTYILQSFSGGFPNGKWFEI